MTPSASVVIPCFNVADTLDAQLARLLPQVHEAGAEVILVDNNSSDRTAELLARAARDSHVTIAAATAVQGASHARNVGVRHARSDRLLFCDADDVVSEGWVPALIDALDENPVVTGSLDPELLNREVLARSRGRGTQWTEARDFYGLFPVVHGGNMAVRRSTWEEIGPFDENLLAIEDMEWALRAGAAGHHVVHVPHAVVHYRFRTSQAGLFRQGFRYGRNRPVVAQLAYESIGRRPPRIAGLRSWMWLFSNGHQVFRPDGRAKLAWVAGNRLGNLAGSIDARFMVL